MVRPRRSLAQWWWVVRAVGTVGLVTGCGGSFAATIDGQAERFNQPSVGTVAVENLRERITLSGHFDPGRGPDRSSGLEVALSLAPGTLASVREVPLRIHGTTRFVFDPETSTGLRLEAFVPAADHDAHVLDLGLWYDCYCGVAPLSFEQRFEGTLTLHEAPGHKVRAVLELRVEGGIPRRDQGPESHQTLVRAAETLE